MNDGFVSVVASPSPDYLLIRARRKEHLIALLPTDYPISTTLDSDYRYRTIIRRNIFAKLMAARIEEINYPNFKNSVKEASLHRLYANFWLDHFNYQFAGEARAGAHIHKSNKPITLHFPIDKWPGTGHTPPRRQTPHKSAPPQPTREERKLKS
jgi:hypothetical protein